MFSLWPGRSRPVLNPRLWPAVVVQAPDQPGAAYRLRARGLWEAAALLEDEEFQAETRRAVARRAADGWHPVAADAPGYPPLLAARLGSLAPPVLWVKGEREGMHLPAVGIAGSRDVTREEAKFALEAGAECAKLGLSVVSGGARGSDKLAVAGCVRSGGRGFHLLPGGWKGTVRSASALASFNPDMAAFDRNMAFARNAWIYAAAEAAILVASRFGKGGSWSGALASHRKRIAPVIVFCGKNPSSGNLAFARMGLAAVSSAAELPAAIEAARSDASKLAI